MEPRAEYIVQTTHPLRQPVTRRGKKAMYRVRDGAMRSKMFRGQATSTLLPLHPTEYEPAGDEPTVDEVIHELAMMVVEETREVLRLRRALDAAERLIEELDHGQAVDRF